MARVVLDNVSKTFAGPRKESVMALHGVCLAAEDKELLVLVGPSGSGKSTLLRLIAGLEELSAGTISIDATVVNKVDPKDRDIAMVFQNFAVYPHMTVYENLAFPLTLRKVPKDEVRRRVNQTAEMLGLVPYFERLPKALSGGERQRVAVGRAIVRRPKVFLFDEPLSNLDAQMRVQLRTEIANLHRRLGATMIYVTHDQVEAMTLGDRVVVMRQGVVQQIDRPLDLYRRPANLFVAGFIGSPPMNFLRGRIERQDGRWLFQTQGDPPGLNLNPGRQWGDCLGTLARPEVILGLRPEHITQPSNDETVGRGEGIHSVMARVELLEPLGAETYLHAKVNSHSLIARVLSETRAAVGETIPLHFNLAKAHFFDAATEKAL